MKLLTDDCARTEEAKRERVTQVFISLQKGMDVFTVDDDDKGHNEGFNSDDRGKQERRPII